VLSRLLQLNHARYEEEVKAGLHEKKGKKENKPKTSSTRKKTARLDPPGKASQPGLLGEIAPAPQQQTLFEAPKPVPAPAETIGEWDQCVCLSCGKHLAGFMIKEHTEKQHHGEETKYRKVGG